MNKELKAKWLEALRSGKYKQTIGRLQSRNGDAFCCLGVLEHCVLKVPYGPEFRKHVRPDKLMERQQIPPQDEMDKIGLSVRERNSLVEMNDDGQTFPVIADYIEANL